MAANKRREWAELFPKEGEVYLPFPTDSLLLLPPAMLEATANQPRTECDEGSVDEMAQGIKDGRDEGRGIAGTGILQAITARYPPGVLDEHGHLKVEADGLPVEFKFPITMGETRWRGSLAAASKLVPVVIRDQSKEDAYEDALTENINRHNLKPLDEARAVRHIMNRRGLSFRGAAKHLHKDVGWVQNRLDLLGVEPDMQALVTARPDSMTVAVRMNKVKTPALRKVLINLVKNRTPADTIFKLIPFDEVKDAAAQAELIKLLKKGEIDKARLRFGKYIAEHFENDTSAAGSNGQSTLGSPRKKGITTVPVINFADALDAIYRQADSVRSAVRGVSVPRREYRENILPRVEQIREVLAEIEAAGASQEQRFGKGAKAGKKVPK